MGDKLPAWFLKELKAITAKRPRTVIEHLLEFGYITTAQLKEKYGYSHPPRAIRDVRDHGIKLDTISLKDASGRRMAGYKFAKPVRNAGGSFTGRKNFPKSLKAELIGAGASRCAVCLAALDARYLQIDHRVPFSVAGNHPGSSKRDFMLLCGSCNRAKSWSCEHCSNGTVKKEAAICKSCYWATPVAYTHIAMTKSRRVDVTWTGKETREYDKAARSAGEKGVSMPELVKRAIREANHD